jgi:uncharacterized protein (DUF2267 family)
VSQLLRSCEHSYARGAVLFRILEGNWPSARPLPVVQGMDHVAKMPDSTFVRAVSQRAGLDEETTARVIVAMLALLGKRLKPVDAAAVAARLPDELATVLLEQPFEGEGDPEAIVRVADTPDARVPRTVFRAFAERLDEQARAQLRMINLRQLLS